MQTTQPDGFRNKKEFWGTIFVFTLIGMVAVMLLELSIEFYLAGPNYQLPKYLVIPFFLSAAAPGFLFGLWYARKQSNKQYWELTDTELICGNSRRRVFPLASIEKIIVGLPTGFMGKVLQRDKPGSAARTSLNVLSTIDRSWSVVGQVYVPLRENSLVVCFDDGSWLPLCLYALPNGIAIMNELRERFKNHLVHHYNYSRQEIRKLRSRDINELIPAN